MRARKERRALGLWTRARPLRGVPLQVIRAGPRFQGRAGGALPRSLHLALFAGSQAGRASRQSRTFCRQATAPAHAHCSVADRPRLIHLGRGAVSSARRGGLILCQQTFRFRSRIPFSRTRARAIHTQTRGRRDKQVLEVQDAVRTASAVRVTGIISHTHVAEFEPSRARLIAKELEVFLSKRWLVH